MRLDGSRGVRRLIAALVFTAALAPLPSRAATCDDWLRQTRRITGSYVPAGEAYARSFAFAMMVECKGAKEVVTVQRATGHLPVCTAGQQVEVVGTLIWSKYLVDGHYEINNPSGVTCRDAASDTTTAAARPSATSPAIPPPPPAATPPPPAEARTVGVRTWVGRYQDSRGAGDVTFTLVRGVSVVSGSWRLRTGGGGPVTGTLEADGRRVQLRLENIAPECAGTFEGAGEITDTRLVATYRGKDCEGGVTDGQLDLTAQPERQPSQTTQPSR